MHIQGLPFVRSVGGELTRSFVADIRSTRFEILHRRKEGRVHWHFRQPYLTLLWWRNGIQWFDGMIDGRQVKKTLCGEINLGIFPPGALVEAELEVSPNFDYTIVFIDPKLMFSRLKMQIAQPVVGFAHEGLCRGLAELSGESETSDNTFDLLLEGWTLQALGHMARVSGADVRSGAKARGGLTPKTALRLDEFVRANLRTRLEIADLSKASGLSARHLLRSFPKTFGLTPHRYVLALRIEEAKRLLAQRTHTIVETALACGFPNSQHFATRFRAATGLTPSAYRRQLS